MNHCRMKCLYSLMAKTLLFCIQLLLVCCLYTNSQAQDIHQKLSLSFNNVPLANALTQIKDASGIYMTFSPELFQQYKTGVIPRTQKTVSEWVAYLLQGLPFRYQYITGNVIISPLPPEAIKKDTIYYTVTGHITDTAGKPIEGASVTVADSRGGQITDSNGYFYLRRVLPGKAIFINALGYLPHRSVVNNNATLPIQLLPSINKPLDTIAVSTGYQQFNKDRTTGSFAQMSNEQLNRNVLPNILDRLEGMMSSLQFIKNIPVASAANESTLSIRGRSTINSNPQPLVIIDNFPYEGNLDNLNPNDIESVTLLKDAAAASIWGAFSGNGVIVFTTKKGRYNQKPKISLITNYTLEAKPNLYYSPALASADYIDLESFLMRNNYYNLSTPSALLSPAVDIMAKTRAGQISSLDSATAIHKLAATNTREQLNRYYYRHGFTQQYNLNFSGGTANNNYYLSANFNNNLQSLVRNSIDRYTIFGANTFRTNNKRLEIYTGISLSQSFIRYNNDGGPMDWPYLQLAGTNGEALAIPRGYGKAYTDTAGGGALLDWSYRPLDELNNSNYVTRLREARFLLNTRYTLTKGLNLMVAYQYSTGQASGQDYYSLQTYLTRNLINNYSQLDRATGKVTRAIPLGGIMEEGGDNHHSHNLRTMVNWTHTFHRLHEISAIAGYDMRLIDIDRSFIRKYGYDYNRHTETPVDYTTRYPTYVSGLLLAIPQMFYQQTLANNYLSWYLNSSYQYNNCYFVTASLRRDESNLFGANINDKGVPLWSAGAGWNISHEKFYTWQSWMSLLKIRASIGYTGNVNTTLSAYNTASRSQIANRFSQFTSSLINPANKNLGWEKVQILNFGLDFGFLNKSITGSLELYEKNGSNLIGPASANPTSGVSSYTGNVARTSSKGVDFSITFTPTPKTISWSATLLMSYNKDKVIRYQRKQSAILDYLRASQLNPQEGKPLYSLYSVYNLGLNSQGDPVGLLNGQRSTDYAAILGSQNPSNLIFNGSLNPVLFGSLVNTISWKKLTFSCLVIYKGGHAFRLPGINYSAIQLGSSAGHPEYKNRWKKAGDEYFTGVPSLIYPFSANRDEIYNSSNLLVAKADHIRLQDVKISYYLPKRKMQLYLYINNIGIIWRANHAGIDPDFVPYGINNIYPAPRSCTAGILFNL